MTVSVCFGMLGNRATRDLLKLDVPPSGEASAARSAFGRGVLGEGGIGTAAFLDFHVVDHCSIESAAACAALDSAVLACDAPASAETSSAFDGVGTASIDTISTTGAASFLISSTEAEVGGGSVASAASRAVPLEVGGASAAVLRAAS